MDDNEEFYEMTEEDFEPQAAADLERVSGEPGEWEIEKEEVLEVEGQAEVQEELEVRRGEDTITFKRSHLYAVLLPLAFVAGLALGFVFWGRGAVSETPSVAAAPAEGQAAADPAGASASQAQDTTGGQPQTVTRYDVPIDDDPIKGPEDAAITIIEFSDFECPYCRRWHEDVYSRLFEDYGGQVRLVYRDFPLYSIHPNAIPAAEAANCANEQGAFWEFHDKLFGGELELSSKAYEQYAEELNLDMTDFKECVDTRKYRDEVQADYTYASQLGVNSTPTFFLNGIALVGAQPYEVFQQVIDKELAGELD